MAGAVTTFPARTVAPRRATAESPLIKTLLVGFSWFSLGCFLSSLCLSSFTRRSRRVRRFS